MGLFFAWLYTIGTNLHPMLPETVKLNLKRFKIFIIIPTLYILIFVLVFIVSMSGNGSVFGIFPLIIPVHIFSMFCIFYSLYFNAKILKSVEWQRPVTFNDYAGEFFLIWFFPIGIWFIQPRINKLFDSKAQETQSIKYWYIILLIPAITILLILAITGPILTTRISNSNNKYKELFSEYKTYPGIKKTKEINGKIINIKIFTSNALVKLDDSSKYVIGPDYNRNYKETVSFFIKVGDSLFKKKNNDTLLVYRGGHEYLFKLKDILEK
jgi:glucan phosphoethanolaminetransferase (alkaline phosphatase superfamily)